MTNSLDYPAVLRFPEESFCVTGYLVDFPECYGVGETKDEVLEILRDDIQFMMSSMFYDLPMPKPSDPSVICQRVDDDEVVYIISIEE